MLSLQLFTQKTHAVYNIFFYNLCVTLPEIIQVFLILKNDPTILINFFLQNSLIQSIYDCLTN